MDSLRKFIWLAVIFGILANEGYCKPSEVDKDKDNEYPNDEDDYQADDDDSNDDGEYKGPAPVIESRAEPLTRREGDHILLPCEVRNGDAFSKIWKNGSNVLYLDDHKMTKDPRVYKYPNNTLSIRHALVSDSGSYLCQVSSQPTVELTHVLNVIIPARITKVIPHVPHGQSLIIKKGQSLTLACEVEGHPLPKVTWTRQGHNRHFLNGNETMEGYSITFVEVNRKATGKYQCEATNGYATQKEVVEVHVHYKPEIEIEAETVTTGLGLEPEITCIIHAEPKPIVSWYKDGRAIHQNNRIRISNGGTPSHTLTISNVTPQDFGAYSCFAINSLGNDTKTLILSGKPTKPVVKVQVSDDGKSPEVSWTVESYSPITAYELTYQTAMGTDGNTTIRPMVREATDKTWYSGSEILRDLAPVEYFVKVRAMNSHGWSDYSDEQQFSGEAAADGTGGAEDLRPMTVIFLVIMYTISRIFI